MSTRSAFLSHFSSSPTWREQQTTIGKKFSSAVMSLFVLLQMLRLFLCANLFHCWLSFKCNCSKRAYNVAHPETCSASRLWRTRNFFRKDWVVINGECFSIAFLWKPGFRPAMILLSSVFDWSFYGRKKEENIAGKELLSISSWTSSLAVSFVGGTLVCCLLYQLN